VKLRWVKINEENSVILRLYILEHKLLIYKCTLSR